MAVVDFLHSMDLKEILQNSSPLKKPIGIWNNFTEMFLGLTLFKNYLRNFGPSINMALVNGGFMHYTDMKKFLKNLLLQSTWSDFEIISQNCSLSDLSQKLLSKFLFVIKHGSSEWGLLLIYGHEQIPKKSSLKLLVRF